MTNLTKTDDGRQLMSYVHFTFGRVAFFCFQVDSAKFVYFFLFYKAYILINKLSLYRAGTVNPSGAPEFTPVIVEMNCSSTCGFMSNVR